LSSEKVGIWDCKRSRNVCTKLAIYVFIPSCVSLMSSRYSTDNPIIDSVVYRYYTYVSCTLSISLLFNRVAVIPFIIKQHDLV